MLCVGFQHQFDHYIHKVMHAHSKLREWGVRYNIDNITSLEKVPGQSKGHNYMDKNNWRRVY